VIWKHNVEDNNQAVEQALHYKFREFSVDKEYFRIDKKRAIKIAAKLVKDIMPVQNSKAKQFQTLKNKTNKSATNSASKSLWNDILKSGLPVFIKEAIRLCIREGKVGQPQYRRFSAIRNNGFTDIGRIDLYVLKERLRCVVTSKNIPHARKIIKQEIGTQVEITNWDGGVSFFIKNEKEFIALKNWLYLGNKKVSKLIKGKGFSKLFLKTS
jgi:hypothetical protein